MRVLAIDYGQKRIGLALSDPLGITAQPKGYVERKKNAVQEISQLVKEEGVNEIVMGYPRSMSGKASAMSNEVETFSQELEKAIDLPIRLWDERLTTAASEKVLIEGNVRREKRKEVRDQIAAVLILQGYLESNRGEWA